MKTSALALALVSVLVPACAPNPPPDDFPAAVRVGEDERISPAVPGASHAEPERAAEPVRTANGEIGGILMEGVAFDSRDHLLVVVDQAGGPGSQFADAAAAAKSRGGLAAVNAGFFTPEGEPLGRVISQGKPAGGWNSASSLGSGVWHMDASGRQAISRREALGRSGASSMRELIQAGPLLVENGRGVTGLDGVKSSARVVILWDGGTRWWIGRSEPCSLAAMGSALTRSGPAGWPVRQALNLDGGRSADLWVSSAVAGGPLLRRPVWNRQVRNFLVLVPR
jgi:hypothetical protein